MKCNGQIMPCALLAVRKGQTLTMTKDKEK